jgi:hypothetical protein
MKLSYLDARRAFDEVVARYRDYLPAETLQEITGKPIEDIYEICDPATYASKFDLTWARTFKKANAVLFPGKVFAAANVPAFTSDEPALARRKIYLQDGVMNSPGTYWHEAIHYLQHRDIYPLFYATGGRAPFQMEGLTELLTRGVSDDVRRIREGVHPGGYYREYLAALAAVTNNPVYEQTVYRLNFHGTGLPENFGSAAIVNQLMAKIV